MVQAQGGGSCAANESRGSSSEGAASIKTQLVERERGGGARGRLPQGTRLVARDCTRLLRWAAAAGMIPCWRPGVMGGAYAGASRLIYATYA